MADGLDEIAAGLCSGPLAEFVSSRAARAARTEDPELARRIRALRKPSVGAWVVNVFARRRAAHLAEALSLAADLREAQEHLDAAALTELSRQRRALTRHLAQEAVKLAESQGERVTAATAESVHQTISAAFFDPQAAAAVASGRLIRTLEPSTGPADLSDAVAGGAPDLTAANPPPTDELAERRRRRAAEAAVRDAERARERADRVLADLIKHTQDAQARADALADRVAQLEADLERTRAALDAARSVVEEAERQQGDRAQEARRAHEQEAAARAALERPES
ncbi:transposase [Microbacterium nymphoidis]|uniref:transposase n=1 Tax=Microbacterium nymphoidis TaxID=2898586 RepID=UPI001E572651|nr:transposase [Microbacterium nymphoidis]MCD2497067.1 transposase [Microbacterium nymphoidis]